MGPLLQEFDITGKFAIPASINTNPGSSQREVQIKALAFKKYSKTSFLNPINFICSCTLRVFVRLINLFLSSPSPITMTLIFFFHLFYYIHSRPLLKIQNFFV